MLFERSDSFKADYKRLSDSEKLQFKSAVRDFHEAAERTIEQRSASWPTSLRVKSVAGAAGVFEMTWNYSGPDGRATWEWATIANPRTGEQEAGVRWRRIGDHSIFRRP